MTVGSKQRTYDISEKSNGPSPTVITGSIFLTGVVDVDKKQAMSTIDVGHIFIYADNDEPFLIFLRCKLAELMVRTNPSLSALYYIFKKGVPISYVKGLKARYGMLRAALLFYKRLRKKKSKGPKLIHTIPALLT